MVSRLYGRCVGRHILWSGRVIEEGLDSRGGWGGRRSCHLSGHGLDSSLFVVWIGVSR